MAALVGSGRIVDLILLLVLVEAACLIGWRCRSGRGPRPAMVIANLAAGGSLLLALRAALAGASWPWIACALGVALAAHIADLGLRWR